MVTIAIDSCLFKKPAREGQILKTYGSPFLVGNTSVSICIEARSHNVYTGQQKEILRTIIKFVRIDEESNPIPISERAKDRIKFIIESSSDNLNEDI